MTNGEQTPEKCNHLEKYVVKSIQPNCTETGSKTYRCNSCGEFLKEEIPVNDSHDYHTVTVQPTCTEEGYTVSKCSRCGKEEGERTNLVAPLGHEYKNGVCIRCGAPEPQENGGSSSPAPNYTVTGAETSETSVVDVSYPHLVLLGVLAGGGDLDGGLAFVPQVCGHTHQQTLAEADIGAVHEEDVYKRQASSGALRPAWPAVKRKIPAKAAVPHRPAVPSR